MPRTLFQADSDGFAFVNSWQFDQNETDQVRAAWMVAANLAIGVLAGPFGSTLVQFNVGGVLVDWIANNNPVEYGLCGGMAFAALDYYRSWRLPPRGADEADLPDKTTPVGADLRNYLWRRMMDTLTTATMDGAAVSTLTWMAVLHLIPGGWPFYGGPTWLRDKSYEHWRRLKSHIDSGRPWPIGLIGTTTVPFYNHQVLACGYEESDDEHGTIYTYDMNGPGKEQTITLDFTGGMLQVVESEPHYDRGPLRGFFCEDYGFSDPPELGLRYGALQTLTSTTPPFYVVYGGAKYSIPTIGDLQALGFASEWLRQTTTLPGATGPRDGTLLRELNSPAVYVIYGEAKFHIPSATEFDALGYSWNGVRVVPDGALANTPVIPKEGILLRERSQAEVYVMRNGQRVHIATPQRFAELGLIWSHIRVVPDGSLAQVPYGGIDPQPLRQMVLAADPTPTPLRRSTSLTVYANDAATNAPVAGVVSLTNFSANGTYAMPIEEAFDANTAHQTTLRVAIQREFDPATTQWLTTRIYPYGTVSAPGYNDAEIPFAFSRR
jgi:hypothetical protein